MAKPDFSGIIIFGPIGTKWGLLGSKIDLFIFFSKTADQFFLTFSMKVEVHNAIKVTKQSFSKKILFGPNYSKRGIFGP